MMWTRAGAVSTFALCLGMVGLISSTATATTIQYSTPTGSTIGGEAVNALATFTTSANTVEVKLDNLEANPISPKSIIYDIFFTLSTGQTAGTISSTTGIERTVNSGGTYTDSALVNVVDWALVASGTQLHLDRLSAGGQPAHGVIGPPNNSTGKYDAAGGAIAGNGPHNPFWGGSADFILNVPGVTDATTITAATFSFNTTAGSNIAAVPVLDPVPEPSTITLLAFGTLGLLFARRRR
jgi:hypothetical protein